MPNRKLPEYILLSDLIHKLEDKDYYRVFAKTLLMTVTPEAPIPADNELVKEMFQYFIRDNQLKVEYKNSVVPLQTIEAEKNFIWEKEIYVKVKDLKKLYANKCIVLPNSLFIDKNTANPPSI